MSLSHAMNSMSKTTGKAAQLASSIQQVLSDILMVVSQEGSGIPVTEQDVLELRESVAIVRGEYEGHVAYCNSSGIPFFRQASLAIELDGLDSNINNLERIHLCPSQLH